MKLPSAFIKDSENINVVIETPKNSSIKYTYEPENEMYKLSKILPEGLKFPLHFGFIPGTLGEDGDPVDVLVLMDEPTYPGCLVECTVIGAIKAEQTERDGTTVRNDRLLSVALISQRHSTIKSLKDVNKYLLEGVINFFITYNELSDKKFKPLGNLDNDEAIKLIKESITNA